MFKKKDEDSLTASQVFKNSLYCVKNVFNFHKPYFFTYIIIEILAQSVYAYESSYYYQTIVNSIAANEPFSKICAYVIGFFAITIICSIAQSIFYLYSQDMVWTRFNNYYNKKLFKVAGNADLQCYENPEFYNKYTMALDNTSNRIMQVFCNTCGIFGQAYRVVFLLIAMFNIDKFSAVFLLFPLIGNFIFATRLNRLNQKVYKESTKFNRVIQYVMRTLHLQNYSKEMRLTNVYDVIQNEHKQAIDSSIEIIDKYSFKRGFLDWIKGVFMFSLIFEGVLAYTAYKAIVVGSVSLAGLTVMVGVMSSAAWGIINLCNSITNNQNECFYVQNAQDFIAHKPAIPENSDGIDAPNEIESIEFKNVYFSYKKDKPNLKNISFKLEGKKIYAFVGQNGAGKTTVVKLILRLYDVDEGEILLNGINIKEYNLSQYRKLFSAAFQDYRVIADSVLNNITMGADVKEPEKAAVDALKKVDLYDKVATLENGINTVLTKEFDETGAVLSGGQYQKLACARAIVQNRPAMIFDEPTSALDPIAEYHLFDTIMKESFGKTTVFISHRLSSVKQADCVLMFKNGELTEMGSHKQLMENNSDYATMYSHQADSYLAKEVTQ